MENEVLKVLAGMAESLKNIDRLVLMIAEASNAIPAEPTEESTDVIEEMDKLRSFMDSGHCEVYDPKSAERIANHLNAHNEPCEVVYNRNPMVGDCWLIRRIS